MIQLRPYQESCVRAIFNYMSTRPGHPIACLPTGAGKSVVIAELIRRAIAEYAEARIVCLSHVAEILQQNSAELLGFWPKAPVGLYGASLGKREINAQILFASVQSIYDRGHEIQQCDLLIIDECHLLSPNSNTMYQKLISTLMQINPHMRIIGTSATPYRLDSGYLCGGKDSLFTDVAYDANVKTLIEQGYLSPLITINTETQLDTTGVAVRGGEYVPSQLEAAVDIDSITQAAVDEIVFHGQQRKAWLVFATGVSHAFHIRDAIRDRGFSCETVTGETTKEDRKRILDDYKNGKIRCLTNANVLTTGVNVRRIDLLAFLRPTKSASLFCQMAGRAMRLSPETGKIDALVLDFANLIAMHGPIDFLKPKIKSKNGEVGEAPTKKCPNCGTGVYLAAPECPDCGFVFPERQPKLEAKASALPIISKPPEWIPVEAVTYARHVNRKEPDKLPTLRVSYLGGLSTYSEWKGFDYPQHSYAKRQADKWWSERSAGPAPGSLDEALKRVSELRQPAEIQVRPKPGTKFFEIMGARF